MVCVCACECVCVCVFARKCAYECVRVCICVQTQVFFLFMLKYWAMKGDAGDD
jgi:hypothetical protein